MQTLSDQKRKILCPGNPKSGTTSLAGLFRKHYRTEHEPERNRTVAVIHDHYTGALSDRAFVRWHQKRKQRLNLDVESNCFLGYRPDLVKQAYPDAKFILTVREPFAWLESIFNNNLLHPASRTTTFTKWHMFFFEPHKYVYTKHDKILQKYNLYPVAAYLSFWARANSAVLDAIPDRDLLVLRTKNIQKKTHTIAEFLNVSSDSITEETGYLNRAPIQYGIRDLIDPGFLEECLQRLCEKVRLDP